MTTGSSNYGSELFAEFENLISGAGNDTITGTARGHAISTNGGDDTINAGGGSDTTNGGDGNDTRSLDDDFVNFPTSTTGGTGTDWIDYSAIAFCQRRG